MYSRRLLLTNWSENFKLKLKNPNIIEDEATKVRFIAFENEYGTIMYSDKIFNGKELIDLPNIKYYYVNTMMIDHSDVIAFLKNMQKPYGIDEDTGFLHKETIYKLKDDKR